MELDLQSLQRTEEGLRLKGISDERIIEIIETSLTDLFVSEIAEKARRLQLLSRRDRDTEVTFRAQKSNE
jgi:hypothetical protein